MALGSRGGRFLLARLLPLRRSLVAHLPFQPFHDLIALVVPIHEPKILRGNSLAFCLFKVAGGR